MSTFCASSANETLILLTSFSVQAVKTSDYWEDQTSVVSSLKNVSHQDSFFFFILTTVDESEPDEGTLWLSDWCVGRSTVVFHLVWPETKWVLPLLIQLFLVSLCSAACCNLREIYLSWRNKKLAVSDGGRKRLPWLQRISLLWLSLV